MIKLKNMVRIFLLITIMIFTLTGCVAVSFSDNESISGKGKMISKDYSVTEYSAVTIDANVTVIYTAADSNSVEVEIQENLLEYLDVSVKNGRLTVKNNKNFITTENNTPVIYITAPTLNDFTINGIVKIKDSAPIQSSEFRLLVDGSLNGNLKIDTNKLTLDIDGISNIVLSGRASLSDITLDGAGNLNAYGLETENSSVQLDGSGNISLSCSDILNVQINGAGTVNYRGTPSLEKQIDGIGSINQIE